MDRAYATQLANIEKRTGKSLDALAALIRDSGLAKHGKVKISDAADVDQELLDWIRCAFDAAG